MSNCRSKFAQLVKSSIGSPPSQPARIVAYTLTNGSFRREWLGNLERTRKRLDSIRNELYEKLRLKSTPKTWSHIIDQKGLYSWIGLTQAQADWILENHGLKIEDQTINISCLNESNIDLLVEAIDGAFRLDF